MRPTLGYTDEEKHKIKNWKCSLPTVTKPRTFTTYFQPTGDRDAEGYVIHKCVIESSDGHSLLVAKKVSLN